MEDFIVVDIPPEWRATIESVEIPTQIPIQRKEVPQPKNLTDILTQNSQYNQIQVKEWEIDQINHSAKELKHKIKQCRKKIEAAELKRRDISANAELLHGGCESQIDGEQKLVVFVNAVDAILKYYDNYEKIKLDFKSPLFTVKSPDFASDVKQIEAGIAYFETNSQFRESRIYCIKYQILFGQAVELARKSLQITFENLITLSRKVDPYTKFEQKSKEIQKLFQLFERHQSFSDILSIYTKSRVQILHNSIQITKIDDLEEAIQNLLNIIEKERELSTHYFDYKRSSVYEVSFNSLVSDLLEVLSSVLMPILMTLNDVENICNVCIIIMKNKNQFNTNKIIKILQMAQDRLIFRISVAPVDVNNSAKLLGLLRQSLTKDQFGNTAFRVLNGTMKQLKENSYSMPELQKNLYLLNHYHKLQNELSQIDGEISGTQKEESIWNLLRFSPTVTKIDGRKQLNSAISISLQSLGSHSTQLLMQPILNLKARGCNNSQQIVSATEGVVIAINSFFKSDIVVPIEKEIDDEEYRVALIDVIKEQLILALGDCVSSFGEPDKDAMEAIASLKSRIYLLPK